MVPPPESRPRWADLVESEEENDTEDLRPALDDASYREAPVASVEEQRRDDSRSGLNAKFARSAVAGPKDFSFLLPRDDQVANGRRRGDTEKRGAGLQCTPEKLGRPSTEEQNGQWEDGNIHIQESPRKAPGPGARKRRPALPQQAFPQKSNKSHLRETALPRGRAIGPCSETGSSVQSEAVEATEEEWEHREVMRGKAVAQSKASPEYQRCQGLDRLDRPTTPNHLDRSISKRQWKFLLRDWRFEIQRYLEEHEVHEAVRSRC
eukprot:g29848.t1